MMSFISPAHKSVRPGAAVRHTVAGYSGAMTDAATLTRPEPANALTARPATSRRRRGAGSASGRPRVDPHVPALVLPLVGSRLLRLWGIKQGLPYSYNVDEATHFVPRAIGFFGHNLNPGYFLNPPAYSYLLHIAFELWF